MSKNRSLWGVQTGFPLKGETPRRFAVRREASREGPPLAGEIWQARILLAVWKADGMTNAELVKAGLRQAIHLKPLVRQGFIVWEKHPDPPPRWKKYRGFPPARLARVTPEGKARLRELLKRVGPLENG